MQAQRNELQEQNKKLRHELDQLYTTGTNQVKKRVRIYVIHENSRLVKLMKMKTMMMPKYEVLGSYLF